LTSSYCKNSFCPIFCIFVLYVTTIVVTSGISAHGWIAVGKGINSCHCVSRHLFSHTDDTKERTRSSYCKNSFCPIFCIFVLYVTLFCIAVNLYPIRLKFGLSFLSFWLFLPGLVLSFVSSVCENRWRLTQWQEFIPLPTAIQPCADFWKRCNSIIRKKRHYIPTYSCCYRLNKLENVLKKSMHYKKNNTHKKKAMTGIYSFTDCNSTMRRYSRCDDNCVCIRKADDLMITNSDTNNFSFFFVRVILFVMHAFFQDIF
jgi:hypothetical protein